MATLGYVRSSNGPDLARVYAGQQLVSHVFPNTTGQTLRITHVSAWVGNWGGTATMRFGIWAASSSSDAPGTLLAQTVEFSPTVNYMDGGGGQLRTVALTTPYDLAPGQVIALGVATRNSDAGIAMYQAADISRPNENFYRKSITGTTLQSASGSTATNEGHLAISVTGDPPPPTPDPNDPPNAPTLISPTGNITGTVTPRLRFRHSDPNGNSTNRVHVQVQTSTGGNTLMDLETGIGTVANNGVVDVAFSGSPMFYHLPYRWRARARDTKGDWGPFADWQTFTPLHSNSKPNPPSSFDGVGNTNGSLGVLVSARFTDPDYPTLPNGQQWEWFDAKQIVIRRISDNALIYDSGVLSTSGSQRSNNRSQTFYSLPEWDVQYRWYERHRDRSGAWSEYASTWVRARSGASVERPTTPSGKVTNLSNPGIIRAVYRNTAGLSANRVRVILYSDTGALIRTGESGISAVPNSVMEIGWVVLNRALEPGRHFQIGVQARDTAGNWSDVSPLQQFNANARPNVPIQYTPIDGRAQSTMPEIGVRATDDDNDPDELTISVEIYTSDDVLVGDMVLPWDSNHSVPNSFWASAGSVISGYGTYKWRAQSTDGHLTSAWTPLRTFTYAAVPAVAITDPPEGDITTSQPMIEWDSTGQTHWRVMLHDANDTVVYDTGERTGAAQSHVIHGSQNWIGGERWNNHETFAVTVMVRDDSTLWGTSDPVVLSLEYIPPTPLIVDIAAMSLPGVEGTHYIQANVSQTEYIESEFISYRWMRYEISGPGGFVTSDDGVHIADVSNSADLALLDFDVASNQWYRYAVWQRIQSGVDIIESDPVYAEMMVSWHGTLLHMPFDPLNNYVWLKYGGVGGRYEPEAEWRQGSSPVQTLSTNAPWDYGSIASYDRWTGEYTFLRTDEATAQDQLDSLRRIWKYQNHRFSPDGRPHIVCFREGRGGDDARVYGRITGVNRRPGMSWTEGVTLDFEERHHVLGVQDGGE